MKATKSSEVMIVAPNEVGVLAKITAAISSAGINLKALNAQAMGNKGYFMLVTEDNARARQALEPLNYQLSETDVILAEVPNTVGTLEETIAKIAAADIDINYCYCSVADGNFALAVISTRDDEAALKALNG